MKKDILVDKNIEMGILIDFYGSLLTQKQLAYMNMHYYDDMSLAEIADIEKISRQAVHDTLKRAEQTILDYEDKLKFSAVYKKQSDIANRYFGDKETEKALKEMLLAWEE